MNNKLMSREDYIQLQQERLTVSENQSTMSAEWSEPKFSCPECNKGRVRKNLFHSICITSLPPIYKSYYKCDNPECEYTEYIQDS